MKDNQIAGDIPEPRDFSLISKKMLTDYIVDCVWCNRSSDPVIDFYIDNIVVKNTYIVFEVYKKDNKEYAGDFQVQLFQLLVYVYSRIGSNHA